MDVFCCFVAEENIDTLLEAFLVFQCLEYLIDHFWKIKGFIRELDMNVLDQVVHKAWTLREQQIKDVRLQAQLNQQWIYEVLAAAKEAVSR